jgi:hypothetical protein
MTTTDPEPHEPDRPSTPVQPDEPDQTPQSTPTEPTLTEPPKVEPDEVSETVTSGDDALKETLGQSGDDDVDDEARSSGWHDPQ